MPRAKNEIAVSDDTRVMELAVQQQNEKILTVQELDSKYLPEGESYNLYICMTRAKDAENAAGEALIALGQQLALIKAHESSEQFHAAMDSLDVSWRTANYAMAAARKFSNSPLGAKFGRTTLKVLSVLDDEQIATMEETGFLPGVGSVDEIQHMKRKELEEALRKEKEERQKERDALESIVRKKESKISELEMEIAGKQPPTKEELAEQELKDVRKQMIIMFSEMNTTLDELNALLDKAQTLDGVTVDLLQSLSDGVAEFYSLFDDKYQDFNQDMENIRPLKKEA